MTSTDLIGWGLAALLWLGIAIGATALLFGIAVCGALTVRAFRHTK